MPMARVDLPRGRKEAHSVVDLDYSGVLDLAIRSAGYDLEQIALLIDGWVRHLTYFQAGQVDLSVFLPRFSVFASVDLDGRTLRLLVLERFLAVVRHGHGDPLCTPDAVRGADVLIRSAASVKVFHR